MRKFLVMFTLLLGMLALPLAMSGLSASAAPATPAKTAVEFCQALDEAGVLDEAGATFGECVNIFKGPASEQANNFIAGLCGLAGIPEQVGATNKGQCIKVVNELISQQ